MTLDEIIYRSAMINNHIGFARAKNDPTASKELFLMIEEQRLEILAQKPVKGVKRGRKN